MISLGLHVILTSEAPAVVKINVVHVDILASSLIGLLNVLTHTLTLTTYEIAINCI